MEEQKVKRLEFIISQTLNFCSTPVQSSNFQANMAITTTMYLVGAKNGTKYTQKKEYNGVVNNDTLF